MSEHNLVGLDKKRKFRWYVIPLVLSLVFLSFLLIEDIFTGSVIEDCSEFRESFSIENACNLDENEVEITLKRGSDNINLERIKLEFQMSNSLWKIDGTKCLDVRLKENKYGDYCGLIREEESNSYVFALFLGKQKSVKVWVEGNGMICEIGEMEIVEEC